MGRRSHGEGTIYKSEGFWVAEIQWNDGSGTHRRRRKRKTRTEAVAARDELVRAIREGRGTASDSSKVTVAEAFSRYLLEAEGRVRTRTLRDYRRNIANHVLPHLGRQRAMTVRRVDIVKLLATIEGARSRQLAYILTKAALGPYVRAVDPLDHPFPPRSTPKVRKHVVPPFDHALIRQFLEAVRGTQLGVFVLLVLTSGTRQSEALGLTWGDVRDGYISVHKQLDEFTREHNDTKTDGSRRRVDLPVSLIALLANFRELEASTGRSVLATDFVFRNARGKPLDAANLRRSWRRLRIKHNWPSGFRLYDLRHANASLLAEAGIASKVIAERLGHSSTRLTDDTYQHLMPGMQREATDIVARFIDADYQTRVEAR